MCGIGGFSLAGGQAQEQALLDGLARALSHRGPDGEGRFQDKGTALIHRRLSIIDVEGGAQPLSDSEDRVQLVCNGEIYNFKPHQKALEESGVHLKTRSDSEVALHLYIRHGLEFVEQLEGMYALALHDVRSGDLLLARDPVGIKPLYIAETPRGVAFASEAGALAACGWLTPEVAGGALPELFNRQFTAGRRTLFKGIERLLPGELLVIREGRIVERRRRTLALEPPGGLSEAEALEKLDALLMETTRTHLQSDVPYGAFLSGGIDSSSVLSCMARLDERVTSYTIGFSGNCSRCWAG
jgi:asparagine synthase (glutamine-hydrolysing)